MSLHGRIDDPYRLIAGEIDEDRSDSAFDKKLIYIHISSPPDPPWLSKVLGKFDAENACGLVEVNANVEPVVSETDGEAVAPVVVMLHVNDEVFEIIRHQVAEGHHHRAMKVTLNGSSLPKLESAFIFLKDLDTSACHTYAVGSFEIFDWGEIVQ